MAEDRLSKLVDSISKQAEEAGEDPDKLSAAISEGASLIKTSEVIRGNMRSWLERAFLAGADPRSFYGMYYSDAYVKAIYNDLRRDHPELPELKRGPVPRRGRPAS